MGVQLPEVQEKTMSRTEANQILERVKQGAIIPLQTVNEALAATGDLSPRLLDAPAVNFGAK
jgi:hypothetical protein